jgi:hypothetical protein
MATSALTNLLTEISEDPARLTEWLEDPDSYMNRAGLTEEETRALRSASGGAIRHSIINSVTLEADRSELMAEILFKAWSDDDFREQLRTDPRAVLERLFTRRLPGIEFQVHEETPDVRHIVIPWLPPDVEEETRKNSRKLREIAEAGGPRTLLRPGDDEIPVVEAQNSESAVVPPPDTSNLQVVTVTDDIIIVDAIFAQEE